MDMDYRWRLTLPGERLVVHMDNIRSGARTVFNATLSLRRREIDRAQPGPCPVRYPLMTAQVVLGIHWQALRLWLKGIPVFDHPSRAARSEEPDRA